MRVLRQLLEADTIDLTDEQPDRYPPSTIDTIKKNIRDGLKPDKDTGQYQNWANALHLVHKAFEVANVQRPQPDMKEMWKQYEEIIQYAVEQLSKVHGLDGAWRMSAAEIDKHL